MNAPIDLRGRSREIYDQLSILLAGLTSVRAIIDVHASQLVFGTMSLASDLTSGAFVCLFLVGLLARIARFIRQHGQRRPDRHERDQISLRSPADDVPPPRRRRRPHGAGLRRG